MSVRCFPLFLLLSVFCLLLSSLPSAQAGYEFPISTEPGSQVGPTISDSVVVWCEAGGLEIRFYDLSAGRAGSFFANNFGRPAISGKIVVWADARNWAANGIDIYGYDLSSEQEFLICTSPGDQEGPVAISGNTVVWQYDVDHSGNADIYGYDLLTARQFTISTRPGWEGDPAISGSTVVWYDYRNSDTSGSDIYGQNLSTGQEFPICTNGAEQYNPAISGNIVVWEDNRNWETTDRDIYGYDLSSGREFPICTAPGYQHAPAIYGNIVVWEDERNDPGDYSNSDIYGYDLSSGREFPICTAPGYQHAPAIYGNVVVWEDNRNGNYDIYGYVLDGTEGQVSSWSRVEGPWQNFDGTQLNPDYPNEGGWYADMGLVVALAPSQADVIYVGAHNGDGLFKSTDGGITWANISSGLPLKKWLWWNTKKVLPVSAIAVAPSDPNTVYVGFEGAKTLAVTRDAGNHWLISKPLPMKGYTSSEIIATLSLAIDPTNPAVAYAGEAAGQGIFKTTNGGRTWALINGSGSTGIYRDPRYGVDVAGIAIHPTDPNTIYAAPYTAVPNMGKNIAGNFGQWIYKSQDGGNTWALDAHGLPLLGRSFGEITYWITSVAFGGDTGDVMYLGDSNGRVWKRSLQSDDWSEVTNELQQHINSYTSVKLCTSASDPNIVFAAAGEGGDSGVYKSVDGGAHWSSINTGWPSPTEYTTTFNIPLGTSVTTLAIHSLNPDILWAGTNTGVQVYLPQ